MHTFAVIGKNVVCALCVNGARLNLCRYGLPVNFQAMLLQPNKKNMKKLREVLYELYKHLDSSAAAIIDVSVSYDQHSALYTHTVSPA